MLGRPVSVTNYQSARGITHVYDHAVRQEHLEAVAAVPIVVDNVPRMVLYLANRTQCGLGDRWFDSIVPLVRRLEREIAVDDEVRRRLREVTARRPAVEHLTRSDLCELSEELAAVAAEVDNESLRARIDQLRARLAPAAIPAAQPFGAALTPREVDVLVQVALGHSNCEAAERLGLLPNTVKSYLKTAMRKLDARNRVQAITAAREAGLIH